MPEELLDALMDTLPCEFTLIDADDRIVAWNRHDARLFGRGKELLERDVRDCHPERIMGDVERLLADLKSGRQDRIRVWGEHKTGPRRDVRKRVLVEYVAVRGADGKYLGCVEYGVDLSDLQSLTGEKRAID